jgi:hypothetical protein
MLSTPLGKPEISLVTIYFVIFGVVTMTVLDSLFRSENGDSMSAALVFADEDMQKTSSSTRCTHC